MARMTVRQRSCRVKPLTQLGSLGKSRNNYGWGCIRQYPDWHYSASWLFVLTIVVLGGYTMPRPIIPYEHFATQRMRLPSYLFFWLPLIMQYYSSVLCFRSAVSVSVVSCTATMCDKQFAVAPDQIANSQRPGTSGYTFTAKLSGQF